MRLEKLKEILKDEPKFRLKQVYQAIFVNNISSWDEASNLPKELKEKLKKEVDISIESELFEAKDKKTVKASVSFGGDVVEVVLMRHKDNRNTVCVSTQVGCAMGCDFCLTGKQGLTRNLFASEMVEQVLLFNRYLKNEEAHVTNVVFMGMGEPFANYDELMKAIKRLNDKETFNIGARRISISTAGMISGINKLSKESLQVNLAVSLHSPDDNLRGRLMPINKTNPLKTLLRAIRNYITRTNRKVMIEYVMLAHINDDDYYAKKLAEVLKRELDDLFVVNLISYNETSSYKPSSIDRMKSFKNILESEGIEVIQRYKFGSDIKAACGQLASKR